MHRSKRKRQFEVDDIDQERAKHQQKASLRHRELKKKAYSNILNEDEEVHQGQQEDNEKEDYYGEEYGDNEQAAFDSFENHQETEIPIEPFNLRQELDEGYFDKQGHYIEKAVVLDPWYQECLEKKEQKKAPVKKRDLESEFEKKPVRPMESESDLPEDLPSLKKILIESLKPGESVLNALVRYKDESKKVQAKEKSGKADTNDNSLYIKQMKANIEKVTGLADRCLSLGVFDIYTETRESLEKGLPNDTSAESGEESQWEYKLDANEDSEIFGPFPYSQMLQWYQEGYISLENSNVHFRRASSNDPFVVCSNENFPTPDL